MLGGCRLPGDWWAALERYNPNYCGCTNMYKSGRSTASKILSPQYAISNAVELNGIDFEKILHEDTEPLSKIIFFVNDAYLPNT